MKLSPLPLPRPLLGASAAAPSDLGAAATSELPRLTDASPGLANALILLGHPFIIDGGADIAKTWSLASLTHQLVGTPFRRGQRHRCIAQAHEIRNGSVHFRKNSPRVPCKALLRALGSASSVYGVIDLESLTGFRRRIQQCLASMRGLEVASQRLHSLVALATHNSHRAAHTMLRVGTAPSNASQYGLHYDSVDNVLLQLGGSKELTLAPPSQAEYAAISSHAEYLTDAVTERGAAIHELGESADNGSPPRGMSAATGAGEELRHSRIDFHLSDEAIIARWPAATHLRGLRVRLVSGDVLFIPRGWLHMVASNTAPGDGADKTRSASSHALKHLTRPQRLRPWVSINLFFTHSLRPHFKLFDSCRPSRVAEERARMPGPHTALFERLGVEAARRAYCFSASPAGPGGVRAIS